MATIYGSHLYGSHVLGSGVHSSYLSRKHLKRAIKYGSYYGGIAAAPVAVASHATVAPVVHAPLHLSRYHTKGGYHSSHYYGSYLGAPVVTSTQTAPVVTSTVGAPIYHSGYYSGSRQAAYFAHKASKYGYAHGSIYGSHVLPAATVVSSEDAVSSSAAPVIYGSHHGIYGSGYLSRKHLKRAIKYGSYHSGYY